VPPGPVVGKALAHLLELRLDRGPMSKEEATVELLAWAREQGLEIPGQGEDGGGAGDARG
jgi:poly(A) polymerase